MVTGRMRRFQNHLIGVEQGRKVLFSDFDNGGEMWTGTGERRRRTAVRFSEEFKSEPVVQVALDMWDIDHAHNQRADIRAENVTPRGFDIVFTTWGDTRVARVRAVWTAIGEVRAEDEWDV